MRVSETALAPVHFRRSPYDPPAAMVSEPATPPLVTPEPSAMVRAPELSLMTRHWAVEPMAAFASNFREFDERSFS